MWKYRFKDIVNEIIDLNMVHTLEYLDVSER